MENITETEINKIREIKASIKKAELSLEKFMDLDLSNSIVRNRIRKVINMITNLEEKLSSNLNKLK